MAKGCLRCDLTRIYKLFEAKAAKAAKAAAPIKEEVVAAVPAPKRPIKKNKVEEPIVETSVEEVPDVIEEVVEETPVIEEHKDIAE